MPPRILSISYDKALLATRQMLLQMLGYSVVSVEGFKDAWEHCATAGNGFNLVVLGHSIPPKDKQAIIEEIRKNHHVPVLALLRPGESPVDGSTTSIQADDPAKLLECVKEMLEKTGP